MSRRPLSLSFKGATPEQAALVARKEPHRTERQKEEDAPSEEEVAVPSEIESKPEPEASESSLDPSLAKPEEKERSEPKKKKARRSRNVSAKIYQSPLASDPLVTQTFRIPQSMSEQLQIASMNRKLKRQYPATQQDIVAEALSDWFEKIEEER